MIQQKIQQKEIENPIRRIKIEKVVLSCGAKDQDLEKSRKLLELLTGMKAQILISKKRIPNFDLRPGLEVGTRVTMRRDKAIELLRKLLGAINNTLSQRQVSKNHFSFGIKEYIEIPGTEYKRDIGIRGLNVTVDFIRAGVRVKRKKIKSGKLPKKQYAAQEEIIKFMEDNFQTNFI